MNSKINPNEINVGVDTGKHQLDIYIRPLDIFFTVTNDEEGIKKALKEIKKHNPSPELFYLFYFLLLLFFFTIIFVNTISCNNFNISNTYKS